MGVSLIPCHRSIYAVIITVDRVEYLLVLDDVVASGVASGAVACEDLGTVLQVSGERGRSNGDHAGEEGSSNLVTYFVRDVVTYVSKSYKFRGSKITFLVSFWSLMHCLKSVDDSDTCHSHLAVNVHLNLCLLHHTR